MIIYKAMEQQRNQNPSIIQTTYTEMCNKSSYQTVNEDGEKVQQVINKCKNDLNTRLKWLIQLILIIISNYVTETIPDIQPKQQDVSILLSLVAQVDIFKSVPDQTMLNIQKYINTFTEIDINQVELDNFISKYATGQQPSQTHKTIKELIAHMQKFQLYMNNIDGNNEHIDQLFNKSVFKKFCNNQSFQNKRKDQQQNIMIVLLWIENIYYMWQLSITDIKSVVIFIGYVCKHHKDQMIDLLKNTIIEVCKPLLKKTNQINIDDDGYNAICYNIVTIIELFCLNVCSDSSIKSLGQVIELLQIQNLIKKLQDITCRHSGELKNIPITINYTTLIKATLTIKLQLIDKNFLVELATNTIGLFACVINNYFLRELRLQQIMRDKQIDIIQSLLATAKQQNKNLPHIEIPMIIKILNNLHVNISLKYDFNTITVDKIFIRSQSIWNTIGGLLKKFTNKRNTSNEDSEIKNVVSQIITYCKDKNDTSNKINQLLAQIIEYNKTQVKYKKDEIEHFIINVCAEVQKRRGQNNMNQSELSAYILFLQSLEENDKNLWIDTTQYKKWAECLEKLKKCLWLLIINSDVLKKITTYNNITTNINKQEEYAQKKLKELDQKNEYITNLQKQFIQIIKIGESQKDMPTYLYKFIPNNKNKVVDFILQNTNNLETILYFYFHIFNVAIANEKQFELSSWINNICTQGLEQGVSDSNDNIRDNFITRISNNKRFDLLYQHLKDIIAHIKENNEADDMRQIINYYNDNNKSQTIQQLDDIYTNINSINEDEKRNQYLLSQFYQILPIFFAVKDRTTSLALINKTLLKLNQLDSLIVSLVDITLLYTTDTHAVSDSALVQIVILLLLVAYLYSIFCIINANNAPYLPKRMLFNNIQNSLFF